MVCDVKVESKNKYLLYQSRFPGLDFWQHLDVCIFICVLSKIVILPKLIWHFLKKKTEH